MGKKHLTEVTSTSTGSRGSYIMPLQPGLRYFKKSAMGPFTDPVSNYKSPDLAYDSYDGKMERTKKQKSKEEKIAKKIYNKIKNNPNLTFSDEDGNVINQTPGKGLKIVPIKEWVDLDKIELNEDLAVWFGKKKKPKGSKQPKGPWVNICRKVDGKHPPCGRSDTSKGAYPKCRAAGVAGKMSDSEKRSACQQKRRAEKKDTQTGKGQKPVMTRYKKKKTNEDMKRIVRLTENDLSKIVKRVLLEQNDPSLDTCDWFIPDTYLIDNRKGELQMTNVRPGQWVVTKFSNPNDATNPTRDIAITVPLSNQLQVIWNSQTKSISLTGPSLIGMSSYNTIFGTNKNATDCFVLCETQSNDGPKLSVGIIKLNKSNNLPVGSTTEVRLQNGAVITYRNSHYVGRKRRYDKDNSLNPGRVYGTIEIGQNFTFNELQRKCK